MASSLPSRTNNPFGLLAFLHWNHEWNSFHFPVEKIPLALDQIETLGVGMIRSDIVWSDIHRGNRRYDFSKYDDLIPMIAERRIPILALLHYNKLRQDKEGRLVWNKPPTSFKEFADYVGTTVDRYKKWIHHWEIWNEPNHPEYWTEPTDELTRYSELLKLSYQAAKQASPSCTVLNGGLTEPVISNVKHLYQKAGKDHFDVLSIHTFLDPLSTSSRKLFSTLITDVIAVMDSHGDKKKKIWLTEIGCPGIPKGQPQTPWFGGPPTTEWQQAKWIEKPFDWIRKYPRVEKVFWAFYRDTPNIFMNSTDHFGLVREDFSVKPAYHRLKALIAKFQKASPSKNN